MISNKAEAPIRLRSWSVSHGPGRWTESFAKMLSSSRKALRIRNSLRSSFAGEIDATHPLPDGPWIFSRDTLAASAAQAIVQRARRNPRYPTGSHPDQKSLFPSAT